MLCYVVHYPAVIYDPGLNIGEQAETRRQNIARQLA